MHGWEGKAFGEIEALTRRRDPERFPVILVTVGDGDESVTQFFRNVPELQQYLIRMEPQRWGISGTELLERKPALEAALTPLALGGPTDAIRQAYNDVVAPVFHIRWWGRVDDLAAAEGLPGPEAREAVLQRLRQRRR
ncbi:hypothetical protein [Arhodomonas sp. SL1]|uniref:hypothetical protein n=1 Tax=Arhodomonas sp. SL1 TaxID=3425691 RepID=UPI003F8830FD